MANRHEIMQAWAKTALDNEYLYFSGMNGSVGVKGIQPVPDTYQESEDILGNRKKAYAFAFIGFEELSTGADTQNTSSMLIFDNIIEWLQEQEDAGNYPDFGENTEEYKIVPLDNMASLAYIDENNVAKYMFNCRIEYTELV